MSAPKPAGIDGGVMAVTWHCENIGPRQRRKRIRYGIVMLSAGVVLLALLLGMHVDRSLRALVFLPFVAGSISLFQVRARTCVVLAARKVRDMDQGEMPVTDERELRQLARQSRVVMVQAVGAALLSTVVALALP